MPPSNESADMLDRTWSLDEVCEIFPEVRGEILPNSPDHADSNPSLQSHATYSPVAGASADALLPPAPAAADASAAPAAPAPAADTLTTQPAVNVPTASTSREDEPHLEGSPSHGVFYRVSPTAKTYDTVNSCLFCKKKIKQKMRRHLKTKHSDKQQVAHAMTGTADQQDRKFSLLISRGNFEHNLEVLEAGKGELMLKRRPKKPDIPVTKFLPCPGCLAFMLREDLQQHHPVCPADNMDSLDNAMITTKAENLLRRFDPGDVPEFVREIRDKAIRDVVCGDRTLVAYANYTVESKGKNENHLKPIKTRVTKLAKVLLDVRDRKSQPNLTMDELCDARYFDDIVHVTKQAAGYREGTKLTPPTFLVPTVPRTVGTALGKVCHVLLGVSMREGNTEMQNRISIFKRLLENEWGDKMGRASLETLNLRKQNAEKQLPTTEDMKRLQNHLQTKLASTMESVSRKPSVKSYNTLACVTAVSLMVFNKRRGGESMKIRVRDYTSRAAYTQNETVVNSLSDLEKQIMDKMCLIKTRGKRGRTVPVLIPQMEKRAIDLLVSLRESVGLRDSVPEEALLFSKAPEGRLVNGWYQLKKECRDAGCRDINAITSTNMRKYLATIAQIMNLSENEMDQIASHLGHDITVHRKYYRLPDSTVELAKIAKLLLSTEETLGANLDDDAEGASNAVGATAGRVSDPPARPRPTGSRLRRQVGATVPDASRST
ncbi:uncharacterized protein LOC122382612 [Amphibalanus amphitrite]|nr:uncharacterized protein LOC122382612 [Amphibalanus amphitrite]